MLETCSALMSSKIIAITLRTGAKMFQTTKCRCGKIVEQGFIASPVLKTQSASLYIQPSIPFSKGH